MTEEKEVKEIVNELYKAYGGDTGYFLGLEPKYRDIVQIIVKFTLNYDKGKDNVNNQKC